MLYHGLLVIVLAASCHAYKTGPPVADHPGICESMKPSSAAEPDGHGAEPQTSSAPFEVVLSNTCYKGGQTVKVKLQAKDATSEIVGLFVQARKLESTNDKTPQGTFQSTLPDNTQLLTCKATNDAVGHEGEIKKTYLEFFWTAPATDSGKLVFRATAVHKKKTFWVGLKSNEMEYNADCADSGTHHAPSCITLTLLMLLSTIFSIVASK